MKTRKRKTRRGGTWPWTTPTDPAVDNIADQIIEHIKDGKQIVPTMFNGVDPKQINLALTKKIAYFHPDIKVRYNRIINYLDTSFDLSKNRSLNSGPTVYKEANAILGYVYPEIGSKKIIEIFKESENIDLLLEVLGKQINKEEYDLLVPKFKEAKWFQEVKRHDEFKKSWY